MAAMLCSLTVEIFVKTSCCKCFKEWLIARIAVSPIGDDAKFRVLILGYFSTILMTEASESCASRRLREVRELTWFGDSSHV